VTKPSLVVHHHKLQCIVKNCFAVFKVKDTVNAQTFIECLSEQDFLKETPTQITILSVSTNNILQITTGKLIHSESEQQSKPYYFTASSL